MSEKEQLIKKYSEWIAFVKKLEAQTEELWNQPISEGKWSVRDVVSHILKWDEYFLKEAIQKIGQGDELTVKHLDYDTFNEQAKQYGRAHSIHELAEQAIQFRQKLVDCIRSLSDKQYTREYIDADGHPFQVAVFMHDFISHDQHHIKQIDYVMNAK